ncbi:MAG: hypothetical protein KJ601_07645, partial [Nanoarchaeota archaeon]|nr:hypothetical protein [Nanoarchaeota archaeon]
QDYKMKLFSGETSQKMWEDINKARSIDDLKWALYEVCCRMQELEDKLYKSCDPASVKLDHKPWDK